MNFTKTFAVPLVALGLLFVSASLTGCAHTEEHAESHGDSHGEASKVAVAALQAKSGSSVKGWVRFEQVEGGVQVTARVEGLKPNAKHAIHIHELGDCSSSDGKSAGGHYNPEGHAHAGPEAEESHAGDFGNLQADHTGLANYNRTFADLSIAGDHNPVVGRAIIVHAGEDDLSTQPTGNAGGRIACGTIGYSK
jgi:Cu-Zn family superoxide dismutase